MSGLNRDESWLTIAPLWSKTPSGRDGYISIELPSYAIWETPTVIAAAFEQWLGGDPKHVPVVVRSCTQAIQEGYAEGRLPMS